MSRSKSEPKASHFKWTPNRDKAALLLAQAYTQQQVADEVGCALSSVKRWLNDVEFASEVDRLTLMTDISQRAERLRIVMKAVRQNVQGDYVLTGKDILEWLKFAQSETDGAKLDITSLIEALSGKSVAGTGSDRVPEIIDKDKGFIV